LMARSSLVKAPGNSAPSAACRSSLPRSSMKSRNLRGPMLT
jgi:hypothetical protein